MGSVGKLKTGVNTYISTLTEQLMVTLDERVGMGDGCTGVEAGKNGTMKVGGGGRKERCGSM